MDKMVASTTDSDGSQTVLGTVFERLSDIILDKPHQLRLALACLLSRGHLLIEDVPGLGKTVLAHALAGVLGVDFKRIQFTSDLLPGDIIGTSIYDRDSATFRFRPGPVFTHLLLADEVNRATPKSQSALLEAMEERQVSVENETRPLPEPFFVIATQNPAEHLGTFPLPESQLDRFLMRIEMGYPDRDAELELLRGRDRRRMLEELEPAIAPEQLMALQQRVDEVHVSDAALEYLYGMLEFTRRSGLFRTGLSTRAGLGLLRAARAWALVQDEDKLLPGDLQAVLPAVAGHRLQPREGHLNSAQIAERILEAVPLD